MRRQRRRMTFALFIGNALSMTALLSAIPIASLAVAELTGSARLAGVPHAMSTTGAALGSWVLTSLSRRSGRRSAFVVGFAVAAVGGALAMSSLWIASLSALLVGTFAMGAGRCVGQLSRFVAGDIWPPEKRASAIAFVVWAGSIGAVLGPLMILPTSRFGAAYLGEELVGTFAFSTAGFALATLWYFVTLRPEPLTLAADHVDEPADNETPPSLKELLVRPAVQLSFVALVSFQFVMIFLMTMTPLHIRGHDHGFGMVSGVMMVHALGMFAFSPVTGYFVDRMGARRVIAAGSVLAAFSAFLGATAGQAQPTLLTIALFLLGVGWNFGFIAGSTVLQEVMVLRDRLRLQGIAGAVTWISAGAAALSSGFIMSAWSFRVLSLVGAGIALIPLWAQWREARASNIAREQRNPG